MSGVMAGSRWRRVVVKFGTNLLCGGGDRLDSAVMADLVRQVATLRGEGTQVAVVTSGAVAAGRDLLGTGPARDVEERQVLAAVGQSHLMERYNALLATSDLIAAQALLTRSDLMDRAGYLNARNTLDALLRSGVVPVINENDVVADEELRGGAFGENDSLSALVATLIDADLLLLLSDVAGLYECDPGTHPRARLIEEVTDPEAALAAAGPGLVTANEGDSRGVPAAPRGRGGMRAKVEAAGRAASAGTTVVIAHGQEPDALLRVARGEALGTRFPARAGQIESRKRWLLSGAAVPSASDPGKGGGVIVVDAGAARALRRDGRSLLPAGVSGVRGSFGRGDVVEVLDEAGARLAVGISNYGAVDIERIRGRQSREISEMLGANYGEEVIHRNNLALL